MIKFNSKKSILAKGGYSRMSTLKNPFVKKIDLKGQNVKNMVKHSVGQNYKFQFVKKQY